MDKKWTIDISAKTDTRGISKEGLLKALNSMEDDIHIKFYKDFYEKLNKEYEGTIAIWQNNKTIELEKLFLENLTIEFSEDEVSIGSSYEVDFPDDWDYRDVIDWALSTHDILQAYLMVHMEYVVEHKDVNTEYEHIVELFGRLRKNHLWTLCDGTTNYKYDSEWEISDIEI